MSNIDVWILHSERSILVTDFPGVPVAATVVLDPKDHAQNGATLGNIGFAQEDYKGFDDWPEALDWANTKAQELGYVVEQHDSEFDLYFDEHDPYYDPEDDYGVEFESDDGFDDDDYDEEFDE